MGSWIFEGGGGSLRDGLGRVDVVAARRCRQGKMMRRLRNMRH